MKLVARETFCSLCRHRPRRPGGRYCNQCHAGYQRDWRKERKDDADNERRRQLQALVARIREKDRVSIT